MAFLDSSGVTRLWQHIIAKLGNKVDKETGKGLSTNDYTTTEKDKLAGIEDGANNYTLPVASSTLGGVKTTNTDGLDVLTANGYEPIPIVDGIPYFMPVSVLENSGLPYLTVGNLDLNLPIAMNVGSGTHPVYFLDGYPYETTYTLEASVPANAKFTDTTYTAGNSGIAISAQKIYNKGILSLSQGTTNGTIKYSFFNQQVNNVVESDLKIKGLDTAAYHPESYCVPATRTINNKALSANISLTASDVGAAASSHTHSYLPLTGGTLTGALTAKSLYASDGNVTGSRLVSQINYYPDVYFKNAAGATLAEFYVNTTSGEYDDFKLKLFSSASTAKYFTFGKDGTFSIPYGFSAAMGEIKSNAWPQLFFRNTNGNNLAQLVVPTDNGSYNGLAVNVYSDANNLVQYTFNSDGTFKAPFAVQTARTYVRTNNYPDLLFQNANGVTLAELYANTTTGAYAPIVLRVKQSVDSFSEFTFGKDGKLSCGSLALTTALPISSGGTGATTASGALTNLGALPLTGGTLTGNLGVNGIITAKTYLAVERNSNPQLALKNANSKPLAVLYTETSNGSYGNTHLQVYKSATESNTFTFDNTGNFRATTLQVDGANNWPSLWFKCSSKINPGVLLQANELHGFGIYCYGSDLDNASTRYFESYTFPAPATGLTANKAYTVYSEKNIIYSSSQPTGVKGAIWLKPV